MKTPKCFVSTDYTNLSDAVQKIRDQVATLRITTSRFPDGNGQVVNVPATLALEFACEGTLLVATGHLVTIQSDGSGWPVRAIFENCLAGQGTISFVGNQVTKDYHVDWWGPRGDGTKDDSEEVNAAFRAWPANGTTIHLGPGRIYAGVFEIDHKMQGTVLGSDSQDGRADQTTAPTLAYWAQADGGVTLTLSRVYACTFKGFRVTGENQKAIAGARTTAAKNVLLTTPRIQVGSPLESSSCVLQSLSIVTAGQRADWIGIDIDDCLGQNNEFHHILDCKISGNQSLGFPCQLGTGLRLGHGNVKQIRIERTSFSKCARAVFTNGGSFRGLMNTFDECGVLYYGAQTDAIVVIGDDSEHCTQVLAFRPPLPRTPPCATEVARDWPVQPSSVPFTIIGGRYSDLRGGGAASERRTADPVLWRPGSLTVLGSVFSAAPTFNANFMRGSVENDDEVGALVWRNNVADISPEDLAGCVRTFLVADVLRSDGLLVGGGYRYNQVSHLGLTTKGVSRRLIGVQTVADSNVHLDSIVVGDQGQIEIPLSPPGVVLHAEARFLKRAVAGCKAYQGTGGVTTVDLSEGNVFEITLGAAHETIAFSNLAAAQAITLVMIHDGAAGQREVTWPDVIGWAGGKAPELTKASGKRDMIQLYSDGTKLHEASRSLDVG